MRKDYLYLAILIAAVLLCYSRALSGEFLYDDHFQLVRNPFTKDFATLKILFTGDVWNFSQSMQSVYYRPFHMLTYLLIYKGFGLNPFVYHLVNLLLHLAVVLLFWRILRRYLDELPSVLATLIFALHPVHVEAVAWIAGTPDVMYSTFVLLSFLLYLQGRVLVSLLPFASALFCKEPGILLPAAILMDHWLFRRTDPVKLRKWMLGVLLILAAYFIFRIQAIGPPWKLIRDVPIGPIEQLVTGIAFSGLYVLKFLVPVELNVYYDYRLPLSSGQLIPGLIAFVALTAVTVLFRKNRKFLFGIAWFLIFLVPALLVKAVSASLFSERYLYLSTAGLMLAIFSLQIPRRAYPFFVGLALVFGWISYDRTRVWQNDFALWTDTITKSAQVPTVNFNLATAYFHQKQWEPASLYFERTIKLQPEMAESYYSLAVCRYNLGDKTGAAKNLHQFLKYWKGNEAMKEQAIERLKQLE